MGNNTFANAVEAAANYTVTANGAPTNKSTLSHILDFFSSADRSWNKEQAAFKFNLAMNEDEDLAIRALLHLRDVRQGKGERQLFRDLLTLIAGRDPDITYKILNKLAELGRWDDVWYLPAFANICPPNQVGETKEDYSLRRKVLYKTLELQVCAIMSNALHNPETRVLCAKWAPKTHYRKSRMKDNPNEEFAKKRHMFATKLAKYMFEKQGDIVYSQPQYMKKYRQFVSEINKTVVETKLSQGRYDEIDLNKVPSKAMAMYGKTEAGYFMKTVHGKETGAFNRHLPKEFSEYLTSLEKGEAVAKSGTLYPHDIVMGLNSNAVLAESQWKDLVNKMDTSKAPFFPVIDVSGSMEERVANTDAMTIAISLGLLMSECQKGDLHNKAMTFTSDPSFFSFPEGTPLQDRVRGTRGQPWGGSTDLEKALLTLLKFCQKKQVAKKDMPAGLIILSDMQFDQCTHHSGLTALEGIHQMYEDAGYDRPIVVFWNIANQYGNTPVEKNDLGVICVGGFSPSIVKPLMEADIETLMTMTPYSYMLQVLSSERYNWK